jgi:hypothetical protein
MGRQFMKHATSAALDRLSELLDQIRMRDGLKEKSTGIFYRRSKSFLHFHEDPLGLFADLSIGSDFDRYPANNGHEWQVLLAAIDRALDPDTGGRTETRLSLRKPTRLQP